jgi:hypothetical protein
MKLFIKYIRTQSKRILLNNMCKLPVYEFYGI